MLLVGLCRFYGISLADARNLRVWEVDVLLREAKKAEKR